jgi:transposase-like protein
MAFSKEMLDEILKDYHGPMAIEVPRDREGSFDPKIVPKHQGQQGCH